MTATVQHGVPISIRGVAEVFGEDTDKPFKALEEVSVDIPAGVEWRREIRSVLGKSHALVLLFTAPSKNWDWCLYETGLYTRFDRSDARAVVCLSAAYVQ